MKRLYYYLTASLPMLEFGMKTPFSYEGFLSFCGEQLSPDDVKAVERASISGFEDEKEPYLALREWKKYNIAVRNELVRIRARKKTKGPSQYIRGESYLGTDDVGFLQWISSQDSPLEAEFSLDKARWQKLEELEKGHYFDIDYLITYCLRLQILERWDRIRSNKGMGVLEEEII
jgi:hypothetical protein